MEPDIIISPVVFENVAELAKQSDIYTRWKSGLVSNFDVKSIFIHNVFMFGNKVGFMMVEAICFKKGTNIRIPAIAFLRGDSVSIMPVIKCGGETYTVVVTEARTPIGQAEQTGLPAGMTDGQSFTSAAIKELKEEVGPEFNVETHEIKFMGKFSVSCGGTDEHMGFYYFEKEIDKEILDKINGRVTGAEGENEHIVVKVVPMKDLPKIPNIDMRSMLSYMLWKDIV